MDDRREDRGRGARMGENEPLTQEILRQISGIQTEVKGISRALETLARVEERQAATQSALDRHWQATIDNSNAITKLTTDLTELRREALGRKEFHVLWGLLASCAGAIGYLLKLVLTQ